MEGHGLSLIDGWLVPEIAYSIFKSSLTSDYFKLQFSLTIGE